MTQLLLIAAAIAVFVLWLSPEARTAVQRRFPRLLTYLGMGALALLVATGRLHWMLALILGGALLTHRLTARLNRLIRGGRSRQAQGYSHLRTNNLALTIDLRSGYIDGTLLRGQLRGRRLSRLTLAELLALRHDYLALDREAAALLTAYLDQAHAGWRGRAAQYADEDTHNELDGASALSPAQAYAMLGLADGAERAEIVAAHRRLMQRLHPDRGGSDYLAARINEAKRRLLGRNR
ncbi:MAG: molecular chaperone DnaJ [Nitrococcus sp.]|nr:molecular chaperone DnaJ [Nitrococcus sp.]